MNKKIFIVCVVLILPSMPICMGVIVQSEYYNLLDNLPLQVTGDFERGWFKSKATTKLSFNSHQLNIKHNINHGPIAWFTMNLAKVTNKIEVPNNILATVFLDAIQVTDRVSFRGQHNINLLIEQLSLKQVITIEDFNAHIVANYKLIPKTIRLDISKLHMYKKHKQILAENLVFNLLDNNITIGVSEINYLENQVAMLTLEAIFYDFTHYDQTINNLVKVDKLQLQDHLFTDGKFHVATHDIHQQMWQQLWQVTSDGNWEAISMIFKQQIEIESQDNSLITPWGKVNFSAHTTLGGIANAHELRDSLQGKIVFSVPKIIVYYLLGEIAEWQMLNYKQQFQLSYKGQHLPLPYNMQSAQIESKIKEKVIAEVNYLLANDLLRINQNNYTAEILIEHGEIKLNGKNLAKFSD